MKDGGCSLIYAKMINPNIIKVTAKITMYYSSIELERLYHQLGNQTQVSK